MATQGSVSLDFGALPGNSTAFVDIAAPTMTGAEITSAWIAPKDTIDHNVDEHCFESLDVFAGPATAGVGFRIYGRVRDGTTYGIFNIAWVYN